MIRFLLVLVFLTGGCQRKLEQEPRANVELKLESSVDGLQVSLQLSSTTIKSSEMLEVELVVRSDETLKVMMPGLGESAEKWGDFFVFERRVVPARLDAGGKVVRGCVYTLEPDLPGESVLPGILVKAVDDTGKVVELTTKPVPVEVRSVLKANEIKIKDIAPNDREVADGEGTPDWLVTLFVVNVMVVLGIILLWWRLKKKSVPYEGGSLSDFEKLKSATCEEVMKSIERSVCRVISDRFGLKLTKMDFDGLQVALSDDGLVIDGLVELIAGYEKIQYTTNEFSDAEVKHLYSEFANMVSRQVKEVGI